MVARLTGAGLGLLAFTITIVAGLFTQNPATVVLSRSILALFLFCLIGLVLGAAAQAVVTEYEKNQDTEIRKRFQVDSTGTDDGGPKDAPSGSDGESTDA